MTSSSPRLIHYDLIIFMIPMLGLVMGNHIVTLTDHCTDRLYNSLNTTFMQFTKEVVTEEYAVEGEFKGLHCCAKGYRSIEWYKDGKRYPWSAEETSSLILYPEAANQTIYARHASKIDQGKYTCVLRNATHEMEHHIELKVKSSSPDVPLATFRPVDQFVNVRGSARFYCEAFVGKKDFPKILISIKWYQMMAGGGLETMTDDKQEEVKREDEQIIGSYLTISSVTSDDYGRYLCRIEMGNSETHRLQLSASLINAQPMEANAKSILSNPYFLGLCAAVSTIITFFLILCVWLKFFGASSKQGLLNPPSPHLPHKSKINASCHHEMRIMIDNRM